MARRTASQETDIDFLKDQVQRLSASLGRHLSQCPKNRKEGQSSEETLVDSDAQTASWLTNKRLLTPLLVEYDSVIDELTEQLASYKVELESMVMKAGQITEENTNLHSELRKALEVHIEGSPNASKAALKNAVSKEIFELKEQLQMVNSERDNYRSLLKKSSMSLDAAQKSEQEKGQKLKEYKSELEQVQQVAASVSQPLVEMQSTLSNVSEEHVRCLRAMKAQENELSELQDQLTHSRAEVRAANSKMKDISQSLDEKNFKLKKLESDRFRVKQDGRHSEEKFHVLEMSNVDLEGKFQAAKREASALASENEELTRTMSNLQSQISSMEHRESEIACHVKDSIHVAETAIMEKDQVEIREKQLTAEVERLKATLDLLVQEAGERTKKEVSRIREEYNESIDKMGLEIRRLEQECGEYQAQLEGCQREKKLVEKELEKSLAQVPLELKKNEENMHELQKRMILAERLKDDALHKVDTLEARINELEHCLSEEKEINNQAMVEHRRLQKKLEQDSLELREQRIKAVSRADELQQKLKDSELSREAAESKLTKEIKFMEQNQAIREKELKCRLSSAEEAHIGSMQELRDLLNAQYRLGAKWKVESRALTENYERVTSDLKLEILRYKMRSDELTKQLKVARNGKEDVVKKYNDATKANTNMQQRLKDSEEQVSELLSNEKNLLNSRRDLHRQLDEMKLEVGRTSTTNCRTPESVLPPSFYTTSPRRDEALDSTKGFQSHQKALAAGPLESTTLHAHSNVHDTSEWNRTLKDLKRSIQKVRKDLKQRGPESFLYDKKQKMEDEDMVSDYSSISRGEMTRQSSSTISAI